MRMYQLKHKYNISPLEYMNQLDKQDYKCDICGEKFSSKSRPPHVDHCHGTNRLRSLLCEDCNHGIGKFKDSPSLLMKAIVYLLKHGKKQED